MWWEIKKHLELKGGKLHIGGKEIEELAEKYGTPLYVYNFDRIEENIRRLRKAFDVAGVKIKIFYAAKANSSLSLLNFLKDGVEGIDASSPYEVKLALESGFGSGRITMTAPALSNGDLQYLLDKKVAINADSLSQIDLITKIVKNYEISLRINPLLEIGSHEHIKTAGKYSKFGIIPEKIAGAIKRARAKGLNVRGLHCHAGSNWLPKDLIIFRGIASVMTKTAKIAKKFTDLKYLNFGGGLGISYKPGEKSFDLEHIIQYSKIIKNSLRESKIEEAKIEPGRFLVGDAGILLTRVLHLSRGEKPFNFALVDAGFNVLARPFIYGAYHQIVNCSNAKRVPAKKYLIAGNLCESGDVFNESKKELRPLPYLKEGNILAILNAGAYGFSMSSQYNMRPRPAEVAIIHGKDKLIRGRENYQDLIRNQIKRVWYINQ